MTHFGTNFVVRIVSSAAMNNAPSGYLVARVEIIPGVLFVDSERNPFTNGEWRWLMFHLGDADRSTAESQHLVSAPFGGDQGGALVNKMRELFNCVSAMFESDFSEELRRIRSRALGAEATLNKIEFDHSRALGEEATLNKIQFDLGTLAKPLPGPNGRGRIYSEKQITAGSILQLTEVVRQLIRDVEEIKQWRR